MNLFEANIVLWIQENLRIPALNPVMQFITALGNGGILFIILSLVLIAFKKTRKVGFCCALALLLDLLVVNIALKPLVARARPYTVLEQISILVSQPGDHSFPSGHSAGSFAFCWAFYRSMKKKWGVPMVILATLIALSRLYVGVHYPTDVLAGILVGILVAEIAVRVVKKLYRKYRKTHRRRRTAKKA